MAGPAQKRSNGQQFYESRVHDLTWTRSWSWFWTSFRAGNVKLNKNKGDLWNRRYSYSNH